MANRTALSSRAQSEMTPADYAIDPDEQLVAELYKPLLRLAAVVCPPTSDPADLLQEAIAKALAVGPLRELSQPHAYLSRTIVNLASNERRRHFRAVRANLRLSAITTTSQPAPTSVAQDLEILTHVSPTLRAAVYLVDIEGLSATDAAQQLGISSDALRQRLVRGRRDLSVHAQSSLKGETDG